MKEIIIFVCTDSAEIFFSKLRSAGLNYNLPSFFTESYCAGVSNKHCLLTFFIFLKLHIVVQLKTDKNHLLAKNAQGSPNFDYINFQL